MTKATEVTSLVSTLNQMNGEINERANDESCNGFSAFLCSLEGQQGFAVSMTREFLLGRIEGAEYGLCAYSLLFDQAWVDPNLAFVGKRLMALGIVDELPQLWSTLCDYLPKKGESINIFFPDKRVMEG